MHGMSCGVGGGGERGGVRSAGPCRVIWILLFLTVYGHASGIFLPIISPPPPPIINRIVLYCFPSITHRPDCFLNSVADPSRNIRVVPRLAMHFRRRLPPPPHPPPFVSEFCNFPHEFLKNRKGIERVSKIIIDQKLRIYYVDAFAPLCSFELTYKGSFEIWISNAK